MTAPEPPNPELLFQVERLATFERWSKKARGIAYAAGAVAFVVVLVVMSKVTQSGTLGIFVAMGGAFVAMMVTMTMVLPSMPMPVLRCPYCTGRVPLIAPVKPFQRFDTVKVCPSCSRPLP